MGKLLRGCINDVKLEFNFVDLNLLFEIKKLKNNSK